MEKKSTSTETETTTDLTAGYWHNWLTSAKSSAKQHFDISTKAWNEYLLADNQAKGASDTVVVPPARFPLFWSSIKNLQPAYYARTPETVAKRMFDSEDHIARVACLILERLSKYSMSQYPIDDAMIQAVYEFLIADKATARVYLEEIKEKFLEDVQVLQTADGQFIDAQTGEVIDASAEVSVLEDGITFIAKLEREQLVKVCTDIIPLTFSDVLHTPSAQSWCDVKTIAFGLWLTKLEFKNKFGAEKLTQVMFGKREQKSDEVTRNENEAQSTQSTSECVRIWEIWDKPSKKVFYMAENSSTDILQTLDDPYGLRDFFPCAPFIIGTKPPKSLYPTPMFKQLEPMIDQLHRLFTRITKMTSALRRRGIADKSMTDVIETINQLDDFEVIGSSHFQQLVESKAKGVDPIWYLPLTELANALAEAQNLLASYKQLFFEISGVPDVVRGVTDARETASSQQMKGDFYNVRSSWDQHLIQEMARKLIEMQCDLALARMPEQMIIEVCHLQSLQQEDLPLVPQALQLLKNDKQRSIRIDIETDSLTFIQNSKKQEEKNLIVQTVMQGLTQVAQIGTSNPEFLRPAMQMLMMSLRGVDLGKAYEQSIESAVKALEDVSKQPPAPPPPDYEGMKVQNEQMKIQAEIQKSQMEIQLKQADQQLKQYVESQKLQIASQELGLKAQEIQQDGLKLQSDVQIKSQQLQIDAGVANSKIDVDAMSKQLDALKLQFNNTLEQQRLELEKAMHSITMQEKLMEEKRLSQDSQIQIAKTLIEQEKNQTELQKMMLELNIKKAESEQAVQPVEKTRKKRVHKIVKTDTGFEGQSEDIDD